jgi:hypothetical protein
MNLINKYKFHALATLLGVFGGFLYWKFVGCQNGQCAIKSNPYLMMAYGAIFGALLFDMIYSWIIKHKNQKNDN